MNPIDTIHPNNHLITDDCSVMTSSTGYLLHHLSPTGLAIVDPRATYNSQAAMTTHDAQCHARSRGTNVGQVGAFWC
jgi:hypothetical protein